MSVTATTAASVPDHRAQFLSLLETGLAQNSFIKADDDMLDKAGVGWAPIGLDSDKMTYDITVAVNNNGRSYELTATPVGGAEKDSKCGTLSIDDKGKKSASAGAVEDCWK